MKAFFVLFGLALLSTVCFAATIFTPSLVNIYPNTNVLYLSEGEVKEYRLNIVSNSDSPINLQVTLSPELQPYFTPIEQPDFLAAKATVVWKWTAAIPPTMIQEETVTLPVEGKLFVDLSGEQIVEIPLGLYETPTMALEIVWVMTIIFGVVFVLGMKK